MALPLTRRLAAAAVLGLLAVAPVVQAQTTAQDYPNRPIRL
ncbi:MAG: tripartite tricarboxylate transporter substrate binding protein, partial [Burkholderiales bacterium]